MGQKVNPTGIRLGIVRSWNSTWYASKKYATTLVADIKVRAFLKKELADAAVSKITIQRLAESARITVHTARPGVIIGRKGGDIDKLRAKVTKMLGIPVHINIEEIRRPELDAKLVGESVAQQLEKRTPFRRAMKRAVQNALRAGAKGIRIQVSGRLAGAEIARTEWYREGRVPLHTLRADIDYATAEALTTYGIIGVKVWIFKGEVLTAKGPEQKVSLKDEEEREERQERKRTGKRNQARRSAESSGEEAGEMKPATVVKKKAVAKKVEQ
jgi:small subunit ribosomal protein S3